MTSTNSETESDGGSVGREVRRRLVEWWSKEYCASRMRLAIVGKGRPLGFAQFFLF
jgi:insulysin